VPVSSLGWSVSEAARGRRHAAIAQLGNMAIALVTCGALLAITILLVQHRVMPRLMAWVARVWRS
jgi:hypothetical protein